MQHGLHHEAKPHVFPAFLEGSELLAFIHPRAPSLFQAYFSLGSVPNVCSTSSYKRKARLMGAAPGA
jgi:hypothetical protein